MADYYDADTENGDNIADPSEDALFMLLEDLNPDGNTFITINPADDSDWYASITLLDNGSYEIERHDPSRHQHEVTADTDLSAIAKNLTIWLADRDYPGRPTNRS